MSRLGRGFLDRALEASIVGSFTRVGPALRRRSENWHELSRMDGQYVLLTGATSGLGRAGALRLRDLGATVIGVGRNEAALAEMRNELGGASQLWRYDLADLDQVRELIERARQLDRLDVVLHNAGALTKSFRTTPQGNELTLGVHLLTPYLITRELAANATSALRVIFMTSGGMYAERFDLNQLEMNATNYRGSTAYARAKRAQVVLTAALHARNPQGPVQFYAVHPGWAKTPGVADSLPLFHAVTNPLLRSADDGVDGALWLASVQPAPPSGLLWLDREVRPAHRVARTKSRNDALDQNELLAWLDKRVAL